MELAVMIIVNIFICTVFYLVISLKLEKKASEFREKRMMKIMDDIIRDFNVTAERNISILENRISVMKRMLEHSGDLPSIDVSVVDDGAARRGDDRPAPGQSSAYLHATGMTAVSSGQQPTDVPKTIPGFVGTLFRSIGQAVSGLVRGRSSSSDGATQPRSGHGLRADMVRTSELSGGRREPEITIEKDLAVLASLANGSADNAIPAAEPVGAIPDEELAVIGELFESAGDKYLLINELHGKGYSLDILSQCSGIPLGEIKLVVSLNRPAAGPAD